MLKHKLIFASFEENCAQTRTFSNTLLNLRDKQFIVHGPETGFTSVFMHFYIETHV